MCLSRSGDKRTEELQEQHAAVVVAKNATIAKMEDAAAALEASHAITIAQVKEALAKSERDNTALKASNASMAVKLECANLVDSGGQQVLAALTKITEVHAAVTTLRALEIPHFRGQPNA
jgi:hypothetical protein